MNELFTQLIQSGLAPPDAEKLLADVQYHLKNQTPDHFWQTFINQSAASRFSFSVYLLLYKTIYPNWDKIPAPAWFPHPNAIETTHLTQLMKQTGHTEYKDFHRWSATCRADFWEMMVKLLNIQFDTAYTTVLDLSAGVIAPKWFLGARFNIINSCFQAAEKEIAIISQTESGLMAQMSYAELNQLSNRIANSLSAVLQKGERAAIIMPMTAQAVAIYLAVIKVGAAVVSIADSFSASEIATRLHIAQAKIIFCQDKIIRDGKELPLYEKIVTAEVPSIVVLPADDQAFKIILRKQDKHWQDFLTDDDQFTVIACEGQDYINILFSSGTTGEPKAIPWDHTTPIKCAADAYLHLNLHPQDIFCWPSSLGWMMGPWLIFACLLNKSTIALYEGTPNGKNFGKFIQQAKVTHLGVVPTLVRSWRNSACMEELDWRAIKLFSSTGERSHIEDMLYLMFLAQYRAPIIEYCGGTEIAGAYITGTVVQPASPAACTTPTLGLDFVMIDENNQCVDQGEVVLIPPSIGLSTTLLNKNHTDVYYANMPMLNGTILRRHGDQVKKYPNGFYRLWGRVDDTMNLSGIKISAVEIENVLNDLSGIYETAAVAIDPPEGGASQLMIYAVLKLNQKREVVQLKKEMQDALKKNLNPLFKIDDVIIVDALPRTASNKIMRRTLRS